MPEAPDQINPLQPTFESVDRAALFPLEFHQPAPDFFEGAVLGNGGLGAIVTTRPDAIVIHFGHNNVWDIRLKELSIAETGRFEDVFERIDAIGRQGGSVQTDDWLADYIERMRAPYARPYPRPFPCGSLLLAFDRRDLSMGGYRLDIAGGVCSIELHRLDRDGRCAGRATVEVFTDMQADRLWLRARDESGPCSLPFNRVRLLSHIDAVTGLPAAEPAPLKHEGLSYQQRLPFREDSEPHVKDRAMRLSVRLSGRLQDGEHFGCRKGEPVPNEPLEKWLTPDAGAFVACVQLDEGLASAVADRTNELPELDRIEAAAEAAQAVWRTYWSRSGVRLDGDPALECIWYRNLYFLRCCLRPGVTAPGLFGNWSLGQIGTAWHGDYHMNYNTQQPFWVTFSSNHVDLHLPYVDLVDKLVPVAQHWAREYYGLRGAYFPHSVYPVEMNINPYPVPHWGWEICETPWTVQSLWWHFLYTEDSEFLRQRAFEPIRQATLFLVDYLQRPASHGAPRWSDERYHVFPTVVPELYGLTDHWKFNYDCLVDLTLIKFVFHAFRDACRHLGEEKAQGELLAQVAEILERFPSYATAESKRGGKVLVTCPPEDPEVVYNVPASLFTVFPGEEHGLHSPPDELKLVHNTLRLQRTDGANDVVLVNLQAARLGRLDLDRFVEYVQYCTQTNGTCSDRVLQSLGRYRDTKDFDFLIRAGLWVENFALPVVINECLLQSYTGVLRFFPNWPPDRDAEFCTLRAVGGFLVSARFAAGRVAWITIESEAGTLLSYIDPWTGQTRQQATAPGQTITLTPPEERVPVNDKSGEIQAVEAGS